METAKIVLVFVQQPKVSPILISVLERPKLYNMLNGHRMIEMGNEWNKGFELSRNQLSYRFFAGFNSVTYSSN